MICNNCGAEYDGNVRFCKNCGNELKNGSDDSERICPACGVIVSNNAAFCKKCGYKFDSAEAYADSESGTVLLDNEEYTEKRTFSEQSYGQQSYNANNTGYSGIREQEITEEQLPAKYRPLGAWAYFGWSLLFTCVPFGFIVAIIFAVGKTENINLRNFARSMFCFLVVWAIILLLLLGSAGCSIGLL